MPFAAKDNEEPVKFVSEMTADWITIHLIREPQNIRIPPDTRHLLLTYIIITTEPFGCRNNRIP